MPLISTGYASGRNIGEENRVFTFSKQSGTNLKTEGEIIAVFNTSGLMAHS